MTASPKPGLLYVRSRITSPALSTENFLKWYMSDHIPEVIATSGVSSALFFHDIDLSSKRPYLAVYDLPDIAFVESEDFKKLNVHSKLLPGSGCCYDSIDFDVRSYERVQEYAPRGEKIGAGNCMMTAAIETAKDVTPEDFDAFYRDETVINISNKSKHLPLMTKSIPSYVRSLRYKLAAKELSTEAETASSTEAPQWFALHEYKVEDPSKGLPMAELAKTAQTEWAAKVFKDAEVMDVAVWEVLGRWGDVDGKGGVIC